VSDDRQYRDIKGNPCSLDTLCRKEPEWAANRIRANLSRIAALESELADVRTLVSALNGLTGDIVITEHGVTLQDGGPHFGSDPWDGLAKAAAWVREKGGGK